MATAEQLYGSEDFWSNYQPMLEDFGTIRVQIDEQGYQGDSWVLYQNGSSWGYLCFGWGSCSGCDALQGCSSLSDVQDLMDSLREDIQWFDTATECLAWFRSHDWEGDYSNGPEQREFVERAMALLEGGRS